MHSTRLAAVLALLALALVACGPGASPSAPTSAPAASPSASPPESASPTAEESPTEEASPTEEETDGASGEVTVAVADSELGEILVDGAGRTLYAFTDDTAGEPTCAGDCAAAWPPLTVDGEISVGEGLDDSDFSTVDSPEGGTQVKVGDWPLYYFAQDQAAGDVNGQGVGGKWFVVSPSGELIRE
jgi:predicted lipoprotein with Yx(FWY)xxD motif